MVVAGMGCSGGASPPVQPRRSESSGETGGHAAPEEVVVPDGVEVVPGRRKPNLLGESEVLLQVAHRGAGTFCLSADGTRLASAGWYGAIKVWDASTGLLLRTLGETGQANAIAISPDGKRVILADGSRLRLWDVVTGAELRTYYELGGEQLTAVSFAPGGREVISAGEDGEVKLLHLGTGRVLRTWTHGGAVRSMCFDGTGRRVLSGSSDGTMKLWDVTSGKLLRSFEGHEDGVNCVAFSPDGRTVLSGSTDETARIWNAHTGDLLHTLPVSFEYPSLSAITGASDYGGIMSASYSPSGRRVLTYGSVPVAPSDDVFVVWDAKTGQRLARFVGRYGIGWVEWSADGRQMFAGGGAEGLQLRDAETFGVLRRWGVMNEELWTMGVCPDGQSVLVGQPDGRLCLWDLTTGAYTRVWKAHDNHITSVAVSDDGTVAVSGSVKRISNAREASERVNVWQLETGRLSRSVRVGDAVREVCVSPDGRQVVFASDRHGPILADAVTGNPIRRFPAEDHFTSLCFSPDGKLLLTAGEDATAKVWDVAEGELLHAFPTRLADKGMGFPSSPKAVFSPDGRRILTADKEIRVWDCQTGDRLRRFAWEESPVVSSIDYSPDGRRCVALGSDKALVIDAETGSTIASLERPAGHSMQFCFSGHRIVSASRDGQLRLWDAETGRFLARLTMLTAGEGVARKDHWVCLTAPGYFACSEGAEKYITVRKKGTLEVEPIMRRYAHLKDPAAVAEFLSGGEDMGSEDGTGESAGSADAPR